MRGVVALFVFRETARFAPGLPLSECGRQGGVVLRRKCCGRQTDSEINLSRVCGAGGTPAPQGKRPTAIVAVGKTPVLTHWSSIMSYCLLTGATGLLGSYLLRDSLLAGHRMALLVRPSGSASARERVEDILALGAEQGNHPAASGRDRGQPGGGRSRARRRQSALDRPALRPGAPQRRQPYVSRDPRRRALLVERRGHRSGCWSCAATWASGSFTMFRPPTCAGCAATVAAKAELDVGQTFGNDYERSKVQAETMVRQAKYLDRPTIFRPAIIVGDSQSGYTSTFHGFYAPAEAGPHPGPLGRTRLHECRGPPCGV